MVETRRVRPLVVLMVLLVAGCDGSPRRTLEQATRAIDRQRIADHGTWLASDAMAGRHFASAEAESAVVYVLRHLQRHGIPPVERSQELFAAGPAAFTHVFGATLFRLGPRNRLATLSRHRQRSLRLGDDYLPLLHSRNERSTGRLVVVGHPAALEGKRLDLRERIVLVEPEALPTGPSVEEILYRLTRRLETLGAAGVVFGGLETWSRLQTTRYLSQLPPDQIALARSPRGQRLNLHTDRLVLRTQAEALLQAPVRTIPAVVLSPSASIGWTPGMEVGLGVDLQQEVSLGQNVLVGFGGHRSREVDLVLAHLDHAGTNAAGDVLNGADDNASGVAALLEIATALERVSDNLTDGVLVAFVSGELVGRQGTSTLLRDFPMLFGDRRLRGAIVLDGIGRQGRDRILVRSATSTVPQRRALERHNARGSLQAPALLVQNLPSLSPTHGDDGLQQHRSSHELLEWAGIPSILWNDGLDPSLYGQPEDDWKHIDTHKVTRVARLVFRMVADLSWHPGSGYATGTP